MRDVWGRGSVAVLVAPNTPNLSTCHLKLGLLMSPENLRQSIDGDERLLQSGSVPRSGGAAVLSPALAAL